MAVNIQYGSIGNVQNNLNSNPSSLAYLGTGNFNITPVRVLDIILDDTSTGFNKYGGWNSIGAIYYELTSTPQSNLPNAIPLDRVAYPLFPNIKQYPLINELTYIITLPGGNLTEDPNSLISYYFPPINAWNSQHHNAVPIISNISPNQSRDYPQVLSGSYRRVTDSSTEIYLGKTFEEKINIHPLLPYEGDTIYEGRWGNSFRLGSTVKNSSIPNKWSSVGTNGDPIVILRNGQTNYTSDSWVPETEDINNDLSSIYLTSTQQLPLFPASVNNSSFSKSTPPTNVGQYDKNQIILNSGRLVFNAKSDSILLLASKTIQLSCGDTLGVDAKQISLTANKVYLGSSEGIEGSKIQSVVLGENLNFVLGDIAVFLQTLNIAFQTAIDSNGAPIVSLQSIASDAETLSNDLLNIVNAKNLLSKTVKTI
jgi:hypothetical protein